jgi:hypothetical protein
MLAHAKKVLEYNGGSIAINARFDKLVTSLRTAVKMAKVCLIRMQLHTMTYLIVSDCR